MAKFTNLVFKLAVIDELMYGQKKLPAFDLKEIERATGKTLYERGNWVMPKEDRYGMMPEVRAHFEAYEIPDELLATIETLRWEGGDQIQCDVAPYWDGEDSLFDFTAESAEDVRLLPNLKKVVALHDSKDGAVVRAFAAAGVVFEHPYG